MARSSTCFTRAAFGSSGRDVTVTAVPAPRLTVAGLPEVSAREVRIRVEMACQAAGRVPAAAVTVQCDVPVLPGSCDLAVAIAALDAAGQLGARRMPEVYGEMALDGRLRSVRGLFAALRGSPAQLARLVPAEQSWEAALTGRSASAARSLADVVAWFDGADLPAVESTPLTAVLPYSCHSSCPSQWQSRLDWGELPDVGETQAVLLVGTPGSGMIPETRARAAMLRARTTDDHGELVATWSVAGVLHPHMTIPFRAPHHTVSDAGLCGGGGRPGEVSLAHCGCLLLDQVAEFRRGPMETLARTIAQGWARQHLAGGHEPRFPARPQLVVGTCGPEDVQRARALFPWTREIEVPTLSTRDLLDRATRGGA